MTRSSSTQPDARTALITGGGTGIGRAAAVILASEGYEVTSRSPVGPLPLSKRPSSS
jgi:NADP-dependent 3-hydroxy acid dehydrogenase YdfG